MKKDLRNAHLSGKVLDQDLRIKMPDDNSKEMSDKVKEDNGFCCIKIRIR